MAASPTPGDGQGWRPSRRKQAFDWYLTRAMRVLGGTGFAWELVVDKGRNPLTMLLSVQLAATKDIVTVIRGLVAQARMEKQTLDQMTRDEEDE